MKNTFLIIIAVIFLASCASPKYTYHFDTYDYNSGRKAIAETKNSDVIVAPEPATMTASISPEPVIVADKPVVEEADVKAVAKKYSEMSKAEKKEFRKEVKEQIKSYSKSLKDGDGVKASSEMQQMDNDLKLAIIFGAVGLTLTLFGGINEAFWILGVISIVVGVVFLIKWLVRQ